MHFHPDKLVFGVAPGILKDCAQQLWSNTGKADFCEEDFFKALGAPAPEGQSVLRELIQADFVAHSRARPGRYDYTRLFGQLACAKISNGIPRLEANELLVKIMGAVDQVNAQPDRYEHRVKKLAVFGSWLGETPVLGDIDIAFELSEIPHLCAVREDEDPLICRHRTSASYSRAARALRIRQPNKVSLHHLNDVIRLGTFYQFLFWDNKRSVADGLELIRNHRR
ncbi:hypothetical protein IMW82_13545 [Rhodanobacter sp. B2A1Ga4]|uniref:hypothetical protein n=1 Tax=Rhodanobacter sp. B2A1Ga4 TaxID=2778647 RepID=UPI001B38AA14|nr:hypothetical protein [Rhodanobacter sp. B2A1Ga4]MBQ4855696.1 hypothetical protein [Rhodanobacter sp. B2A1Ga4]